MPAAPSHVLRQRFAAQTARTSLNVRSPDSTIVSFGKGLEPL